MLSVLVEQQLKKTDFRSFSVPEAIELLKADILDEIEYANRGCWKNLRLKCSQTAFHRRHSWLQNALRISAEMESWL